MVFNMGDTYKSSVVVLVYRSVRNSRDHWDIQKYTDHFHDWRLLVGIRYLELNDTLMSHPGGRGKLERVKRGFLRNIHGFPIKNGV